METKKEVPIWRYPALLLFGIGTANFGAWIYLIAINLIVLEMTHSPFAVAGLYMVKPLASVITNAWAGSMIDRMNKRNLMIALDIFRAIMIALLPFASSLWLIYALVLLINVASSIFEPASFTYITKLIPSEHRQRFNALRSLIDSGAFLIGPAIAGILFMLGTPAAAIFINAGALFISGLVTMALPNLDKNITAEENTAKLSWSTIREDWKVVIVFSRKQNFIMLLFFLFNCLMVMSAAVDSQEASFAKSVLSLTDSEYGFLVSIAGAGIVGGAIVNAIFAEKLSVSLLIGIGSLMVAVGYLIYAFSSVFHVAAAGFFILAFALAFANTGFQTFTQDHIPVEIMGRLISIYALFEALLTIIFTAILGVIAQMISIRIAVISAVCLMFGIALLVFIWCIYREKQKEYAFKQVSAGS